MKVAPKTNETTSESLVKLEICEHRRLRGAFWEKLELNHVCLLVFRFIE